MYLDIKLFQKRYGLSNKDMANVCQCSLPTIQKWRSGEVSPPGPAQQLMKLLDHTSEGDPAKLRNLLKSINRSISPSGDGPDSELIEIESSMSKAMDRLELMLESRRKDRELAESEARYRSMVESQDQPVCRWKPDTTLTYANAAYSKLFSAHGDEIVGQKWIEFIPEERRDSVLAIVSDMVRRAEPEITKHESVDKDGEVFVQEWRDIPIKNETGDVIELHSVGKDITELVSMREELEESRKTRSSLIELCDHPILVVDAEGQFLEYNQLFKNRVANGKGNSTLDKLAGSSKRHSIKNLLQRFIGNEQMQYRMKLGKQVWFVQFRMLSKVADSKRFIALFNESDGSMEHELLRTRIENEIVLGGHSTGLELDETEQKKIHKEMSKVGHSNGVDRLYVFRIDWEKGVFDNILEWCAKGIEPHINNLKEIPNSEYPWWTNRIRKGHWIQHDDINKLPRTASVEREILQAQGIKAILVAPIFHGDKVVGFAGFDQNSHHRLWHQQEIKSLEAFSLTIAEVITESQAT